MRHNRRIALATLYLATAVTARAQLRTWVSGVGDDANPCSRTAPCKTFAGAISKTAAGGEINCIDNGAFGSVTIGKSLTIDCSNVEAGLLASSTNGIVINAAAADKIILRGLDINGGSPLGLMGIKITNILPGTVIIENCHIYNFNDRGINIGTTSGAGGVTIRDTRIHNINNHAIASVPSGGAVNLVVDRVQASNNAGLGIDVFTGTKAVVRNSSFTHAAEGIRVEAATAEANIYQTTISHNQTGVNVTAGIARLFASQITDNTTNGIIATGTGQVLSHQNNEIRGNVGNETPTMGIGQQ